jgi:hypothetical protein
VSGRGGSPPAAAPERGPSAESGRRDSVRWMALLMGPQWLRATQVSSSEQEPPVFAHSVRPSGPSSASTMSATLMASAGRERLYPPWRPRWETTMPPRHSSFRILLTVGSGTFDACARSWAVCITGPPSRARCVSSTIP